MKICSMVKQAVVKTKQRKKSSKKAASKIKDLLAFDRDTTGGVNQLRLRLLASSRTSANEKTESSGFATGIIGVDEVGRGCLAGPVVASAVMLKDLDPSSSFNRQLKELDDSKKLSQEQRESLADIISGGAYSAVAECSPEEIDQINILQASLLAMHKAINKLIESLPFEIGQVTLLVDGNKKIRTCQHEQITVIKGDSRSASIAAASVLAKVYRDDLMKRLDKQYPDYLWRSNKGYPSRAHKLAIQEYGLTDWHRKTFRWQLSEEDN